MVALSPMPVLLLAGLKVRQSALLPAKLTSIWPAVQLLAWLYLQLVASQEATTVVLALVMSGTPCRREA